MTDEQALLATLFVLYLIECVAWVPRGAVAFLARAADRATLGFPSRTLGNPRGGLVMGRLLPHFGGTFILPQWPVSLGCKGILAWVSDSMEPSERAPQTGTYLPFDKLPPARSDGRDVRIGENDFLTAASGRLAEKVVAAVERLHNCPEKKREAAVEKLVKQHCDAPAAREQLSQFYGRTALLRTCCLVLVMLVFGLVPATVILFGLARTWYILLPVLYLATWTVVFLFFRAHRELMPQARTERIGQAVVLALFPISAMRAPDYIARPFLHGFHPLAAGAALLEQEGLRHFAEHLVRDAHHPRRPLCENEAPEAQAVEAFYRQTLKKELMRSVREAGLDPDAMLLPPKPEDAGIRSYCPRCFAEYAHEEGACDDCGGVPVLKLPPSPPPTDTPSSA